MLATPRYAFTTAHIMDSYAASVPEPVTWALLVAGVGVVGARVRRRQAGLSIV